MPESTALEAEAFDLLSDRLLDAGDTSPAMPQTPSALPHGETRRYDTRSATQSLACRGVFLRVERDLGSIETEWRAFEAEADCTAFQRFDWLSKWQLHIGSRQDTRPAIVVGRDLDGGILFMLQLAVERQRLARRLTWLGSELCDYNGPVLSRRFAERIPVDRFAALWGEILRLLRAEPALRFDLVDLPKMPATIGGQANPFMALVPTLDPSGAHLANLGETWDTFYASKRSAATRKRERRQFRHLADFGEVRFVEPVDVPDIERTLEALFAQKSVAFARMGVENFLARPGYREFFRAIATDPDGRSFTHVSRLDVGPTMAGTGFGLEFRGRYYLLLSSYEEGELSRYGPGRAHLQELLRRAIEKGLSQFDFTVGDEPYKRDWSDIVISLYGHFAATTLRGWPVVIATLAFRRAKRTIKQNPLLWRLYSHARGHLAEIRTRGSGAAGEESAREE